MTTPRVLVVGGGFAGFFAARTLEKLLPPGAADLTLVSATDHLCYSPLLPEVAAGRLDPRRIAVPLHGPLRRTRIVQGVVDELDLDGRTVRAQCGDPAGDADPVTLRWDRLVLTLGSVTRTFDTPGLAKHALGLKTLLEAVFIRDHVLRQLELASATTDLAERRARLTFVVVGAGYAGTETAAQLQRLTQHQLRNFPKLSASDLTWLLIDVATRVLPELGPRLGSNALSAIRARGMQVRLGTSITELTARTVTLDDGSVVPTHTVVWTAGVTPPPIVQDLGLSLEKGRLVVDENLRLRPDVWAAGDAATARDPFHPAGAGYPPTAQHAQRQGVVMGHNVAASLGYGATRPYRHRDLGLVADLGGAAAVARPLGVPLTGPVAKVVAKGYHLYAVPSMANRVRIAADWAVNAVSRPVATQLGLVAPGAARLGRAEHTERP